MKRKDYHVAFPAVIIVVMAAFLSTIFIANANLSFADSGKKKSPAGTETSAVMRVEARIKELQDELNITAAQEPLWNNLTQVMRENAKDMDALTKDRTDNAKTMNAVEQMQFHRQVTEAHLDQLNKFMPPFEALYAGMSDEQKKITDTIFRSGKYENNKRK